MNDLCFLKLFSVPHPQNLILGGKQIKKLIKSVTDFQFKK